MNTIKIALEMKLNEWKDGQIKWNVGNQFDETILESALENLNEDTFAAMNNFFDGARNVTIMERARFLSKFDEPELDSAWID